MLERLKPYHFTFEAWRAGSLLELGIATKLYSIEANKFTIRDHTIGYLKAEKLWVRPKKNCIAIMLFFKGKHFWTHITIKEFLICFPEIKSID